MSDQLISVTLPPDEKGMVGRQCPSHKCRQYFKLKPGTGLHTSKTHCPYCGVSHDSSTFATSEQIEYAKSVALKQFMEPLLRDFKRSVEGLNRPSPGSLIELKFSVDLPSFQVRHYSEKDVETRVTCDACGLEFSIFGVFAFCPDCAQINAFSVLQRNLEVCQKRLALTIQQETAKDIQLVLAILQDSLGAAVGAFDALGKKLRELRPDVFPDRPHNLFQNYDALDSALSQGTGKGIAQRIGQEGAEDLFRLLQVRHIYEHNLGVVDDTFIARVPGSRHLRGRVYPLNRSDVEGLLGLLETLASTLKEDLSPLGDTS
ncbi:MAG: hypothetical protein HYU29_06235 [Chloroflexi bacterium]|nr:hypothetical protein [Chloroflexota bacterium]